MLDTGDSSYMKFFVDPVLIPLEKAIRENAYKKIDMVGISGGGWTALLVSALEPRIDKIVSVAGFFEVVPIR